MSNSTEFDTLKNIQNLLIAITVLFALIILHFLYNILVYKCIINSRVHQQEEEEENEHEVRDSKEIELPHYLYKISDSDSDEEEYENKFTEIDLQSK
jgi:flagellar biosynthesis/type III secretory pathway M-ring protein FliF/YscJ